MEAMSRLTARVISHPHREFEASILNGQGAELLHRREFGSMDEACGWARAQGVDPKDINIVVGQPFEHESRTYYATQIEPPRQLAELVGLMAAQRKAGEDVTEEQWDRVTVLATRTSYLLSL